MFALIANNRGDYQNNPRGKTRRGSPGDAPHAADAAATSTGHDASRLSIPSQLRR